MTNEINYNAEANDQVVTDAVTDVKKQDAPVYERIPSTDSVNVVFLCGEIRGDITFRTGKNSNNRYAIFTLVTKKRWLNTKTGEKVEKDELHSVLVFKPEGVAYLEKYGRPDMTVNIQGENHNQLDDSQRGLHAKTTVYVTKWDGHICFPGYPTIEKPIVEKEFTPISSDDDIDRNTDFY